MEPKAEVKLSIDGKEVIVAEGTTILEAARQHGIHIPTLCHHPALSNWGGCRLCLVEVDGNPRLAASCVMPVRGGMAVVTSNEKITVARRTILEFLFAERNHLCMFCARSGDCELQDLAYELHLDHLTVPQSFEEFPTDITNEHMAIDHNRCILCSRCIRACGEIAGASVLGYQNRGSRTLIGLDLNEAREESTCLGCGICMQVCPTGAIFNRYRTHHAVKGHNKESWRAVASFCPQCGLMCPTTAVVSDNNLIRIEGQTEARPDRPDRGQLCQRGRFEPLKSHGRRLLTPMVRARSGEWEKATWKTAMDLVAEKLSAGKESGGDGAVFGLVSGGCSNEELLLFRDLLLKGWKADYVDALEGGSLRTIARAWADLGKTLLGLKEASWKRIAEADLILLAGADPSRSQPLITGLIRKAVFERGAVVIVIGSNDTMQPWTSHYLPAASGKESSLVRAFLAEVIASGLKPAKLKGWEKIQAESGKTPGPGLPAEPALDHEGREVLSRAVRSFVAAANPLVIAGREVTEAEEPDGLRDLMHLALAKEVLPENTLRLVILKARGNSAGVSRLGVFHAGSMPAAQGKRGLILLAGEDDLEPAWEERLSGLDFLAIISPYFPEALAPRAQVLLPKPLWLEEEGSYTSLDGRETASTQAVLSRPPGVYESWQTLVALTQRSEYHPPVARWRELSARVREKMEAGSWRNPR
jgi:NADH dehydrogenase/NADH:ubiquinone oxidoreductase subunit G